MPSSKIAFITGILLLVMLAITGQAHENAPIRHRHARIHDVLHAAKITTVAPQVTPAPFAGEFARAPRSGSTTSRESTWTPEPPPGPPRPENSLAPKGPSPLERFVAGCKPKVDNVVTPPLPSLPNQRGVLEKALWLCLAAAGFFFVSLIWNLYSQVGKNLEKAIATGGNTAAAKLVKYMNSGREGDGRVDGQGKWRQANVAAAPISAV